MVSLSQLQDIPRRNLILLVGPPGSGKTTFCQQTILQNLAMDRPLIYVTTESGSSEAEKTLRERGLGETPGSLKFVDAYSETVGISVIDRPNTVTADCANLSSIGIAISKLEGMIGKKDVLLVFDSLVSPYLLAGPEIIRFMQLTLSKFVAEGNAVLACMDEGCGKPEDLGAMMSLANSVVRMDTEEGKRILNVVKHPVIEPARIEIPMVKIENRLWDVELWDEKIMESLSRAMQGRAGISLRREIENYVNIFWPNFAFWSGILWDPKRFPEMTYEVNKKHGAGWKIVMPLFPWYKRLLFKVLMPKNFSKTKDMKKMLKMGQSYEPMRQGIIEYIEDASKTDEHYFRIYDNAECCIFENVGATMASFIPASWAGACKGLESWRGLDRDWNAVETKCIGLGDPYCEFKLVPGEIKELKASLEKDVSVIERIHDRLMDRLMGFLLDEKPLVERPKLGSDIHVRAAGSTWFSQLGFGGERYQMAWRMGGTRSGKEAGERLSIAHRRQPSVIACKNPLTITRTICDHHR